MSTQARLEPMAEATLDAVAALEQCTYAHPWQRQHFADCLANAYQARLLMAGETLIGYFVAMQGFEEAHLLNLVVARQYQGQGWARVMLDALVLWARAQALQWVWLEARAGNARAIAVYQAYGFRSVGVRKQYYPASDGLREDALVMSLHVHPVRISA
ncbi:mycothiol acetyltransferase [mine drainage metagenome]|uniref:Mycothiol acetyltransferase n=1 Tax=mine drainage metagenome TaxID=410659 RepID=A0A1J5QN46_9ZZZZ